MIRQTPTTEFLGFSRTLADTNRLKIVGLLSQQSYAAGQLSVLLGLGVSTVSRRLSGLAEANLVNSRTEGHYSVYSLEPDALVEMARRLLRADQLPELVGDVDRSLTFAASKQKRARPLPKESGL